ncbi:TIGR01906 family membrane protein [Aerococcaceae bacterium DSM 111022]|nr:TIGR01906 family membrane protein [Aerococcaceae bacterium DSM 111022]
MMIQIKQGAIFTLIAIASLSLSITLTAIVSIPIYDIYSQLNSLAEFVGLTHDQLQISYRTIIEYLFHPFSSDIQIPYFSSSPQGVHHFRDVKLLIQVNALFSLVSLVIIPKLIGVLKKARRNIVMDNGFTILYGLPLLLLFIIFISFDRLFILFHQILFTNDYWLFDPQLDPIINVLPESYFMILFVVAILIYEGIIVLINFIYKNAKK